MTLGALMFVYALVLLAGVCASLAQSLSDSPRETERRYQPMAAREDKPPGRSNEDIIAVGALITA